MEWGTGPHRYYFRLYALDIMLNLPHGVTKVELERAMADHIVGQGTLMGTYQRKAGQRASGAAGRKSLSP